MNILTERPKQDSAIFIDDLPLKSGAGKPHQRGTSFIVKKPMNRFLYSTVDVVWFSYVKMVHMRYVRIYLEHLKSLFSHD